MDALTPSWTLVLCAGFCTVEYYIIFQIYPFQIYPEMAGLTFEEAAAVLEHGWRVR